MTASLLSSTQTWTTLFSAMLPVLSHREVCFVRVLRPLSDLLVHCQHLTGLSFTFVSYGRIAIQTSNLPIHAIAGIHARAQRLDPPGLGQICKCARLLSCVCKHLSGFMHVQPPATIRTVPAYESQTLPSTTTISFRSLRERTCCADT